ncbi:MAG: cell surface protein [Kiritimatiellae bacterium]|nr:cell surface protein [Kiritimatiellia bacterium]
MHGVRGMIAAITAGSIACAAAGPVSPLAIAVSPDGSNVWVAGATGRCVAHVDLVAGQVRAVWPLPAEPAALVVSKDGARLWVAGGTGTGQVWVVETADGRLLHDWPAGHSPVALAIAPDGAQLYVCDRFGGVVRAIQTSDGTQIGQVSMPREPIACALTPDGSRLVVVNHLPAVPATAEVVALDVVILSAADLKVLATVRLPNGCSVGRGVALSPDGRFAYVTSILGRFTLPTTQLDRGWMMTAALSVVDVAAGRLVNTVLLDEIDHGAANPWGVAVSADGRWLVVAHSGTHELSVIDRAALHDRLDRVARGEAVTPVSSTPAQVPNDLAFLVDIRERVRLPGNSPRGVAVVGDRACAAMYFTDSLAVVPLAGPPRRPSEIRLGSSESPMSIVRRGEMLFHDAALCFQEWQSCASCHPDGRVDGLNWDLLNDGMGNPKQTKSLVLAHQTPPAMLSGVRATAEIAVRSGIRFIQFAVRPEEEAQAMDEYLKALAPVNSPHRAPDGSLTDAARRGEAVFRKAGCEECHPPPLYTTLKSYDVGTGVGPDANKPLDTPTLREVWRTAPYLDDGRAATLRDVVTTFNKDDRHGETSKLTPAEIDDLVQYLLSL